MIMFQLESHRYWLKTWTRYWKKKAIVDGILEVLKEILNISKENIYCLFRETLAHNHYTGGQPLPEWVPSVKWKYCLNYNS